MHLMFQNTYSRTLSETICTGVALTPPWLPMQELGLHHKSGLHLGLHQSDLHLPIHRLGWGTSSFRGRCWRTGHCYWVYLDLWRYTVLWREANFAEGGLPPSSKVFVFVRVFHIYVCTCLFIIYYVKNVLVYWALIFKRKGAYCLYSWAMREGFKMLYA